MLEYNMNLIDVDNSMWIFDKIMQAVARAHAYVCRSNNLVKSVLRLWWPLTTAFIIPRVFSTSAELSYFVSRNYSSGFDGKLRSKFKNSRELRATFETGCDT